MEEATVIRRASPSDAARLSEFAERVFDEVFGPQNDKDDMAAYLHEAFAPDIQRSEITAPGSIVLIAEQPGSRLLVGYAHVSRADTPDCVTGPAALELKRLYVEPRLHSQGIGRRLLHEAIGHARAAGAQTLWLGVWEHNLKAQKFYAREGFTRVGDHPFVLGTDTQTDWIMQRPIASHR